MSRERRTAAMMAALALIAGLSACGGQEPAADESAATENTTPVPTVAAVDPGFHTGSTSVGSLTHDDPGNDQDR